MKTKNVTEKNMKVCLVGSSGGHLTHLYMLKPFWKDKNRFWVTFDKEDARSLLEGEKVYPCYFPTNRSIKALIKNTKIAWDVLHKEKPDLIISCGAAVAVPFFYIGKMMGAKLVYIEVFNRIDKPTMTGKMVYNNVKFAMVLYDSFSNRSAQRAISLIPLFDKVFSFDEEDAKKHGLQHIYSTFSTPHYLKVDTNYKSSAFFIGTGVDREEELNEDLSYIASKIDGCKFGIVSVKNQRYKDLIEYNKPITYQEEQMYAYNTKCIVEIVKRGQSGITLRTCEAIAFNKKLLTNNASIKNLPFYDPRYMSIFETTKDIDIDFIRDNRKVDYKYDGYFSPKRIIKLLAEERW